tara:strand:+ start:1827 stop:2018 length:192 start_codon:yes stop_codon:yes gene_type:complete
MTPEEFRHARRGLMFSQQALADEWGMGENGGRTIRRWEGGERPINPVAAYAMHLMNLLSKKER